MDGAEIEEDEAMPSESFTVESYRYYNWSSRRVGKTNMILEGPSGEICSVWFEVDESKELQPAKKVMDDYYVFWYHQSQLQHLVDMLRNEKPITVIFNDIGGFDNSRISTTHEPVGEGEES
ncbi:MAG: hypothetical protein PVI07_08950 [Anaerolineae bacterium]